MRPSSLQMFLPLHLKYFFHRQLSETQAAIPESSHIRCANELRARSLGAFDSVALHM